MTGEQNKSVDFVCDKVNAAFERGDTSVLVTYEPGTLQALLERLIVMRCYVDSPGKHQIRVSRTLPMSFKSYVGSFDNAVIYSSESKTITRYRFGTDGFGKYGAEVTYFANDLYLVDEIMFPDKYDNSHWIPRPTAQRKVELRKLGGELLRISQLEGMNEFDDIGDAHG